MKRTPVPQTPAAHRSGPSESHTTTVATAVIVRKSLPQLAAAVAFDASQEKRLTSQDLAPVLCAVCGYVPRSVMARNRNMTWDGTRWLCIGKVNCAQRATWDGE